MNHTIEDFREKMLRAYRDAQALDTSAVDGKVQDTVLYIKNWKDKGCPGLKLTNDFLADQGHFSNSKNLCDAFQAQIGKSPQDYLECVAGTPQLRVVRAALRLLTPQLISSIMFSPNYWAKRIQTNSTSLDDSFKVVFDMSAKAYIECRRRGQIPAPVVDVDLG